MGRSRELVVRLETINKRTNERDLWMERTGDKPTLLPANVFYMPIKLDSPDIVYLRNENHALSDIRL